MRTFLLTTLAEAPSASEFLDPLFIKSSVCLLLIFIAAQMLQNAIAPDLRSILGANFRGACASFSTIEIDEIPRRVPHLALGFIGGNLTSDFAAERRLALQIAGCAS